MRYEYWKKGPNEIILEDKVLQSVPFRRVYLKTTHLTALYCGYLYILLLVMEDLHRIIELEVTSDII